MKKILLVDDEVAIRSMLCELLKAEDRMFIQAENGTEAQALLAAESFDLIISDVIMPDCDGIELIMSIRKKTAETPVIIMSGGGRVQATHYLNLADKLGASRVFEKPFVAAELRKAADELLSGSESKSA